MTATSFYTNSSVGTPTTSKPSAQQPQETKSLRQVNESIRRSASPLLTSERSGPISILADLTQTRSPLAEKMYHELTDHLNPTAEVEIKVNLRKLILQQIDKGNNLPLVEKFLEYGKDGLDAIYGETYRSRFVFDKHRESGKGISGMVQRVFVTLQHAIIQSKDRKEEGFENRLAIRDAEFLTSRWVEREPPNGSRVRLSDGDYTAGMTFAEGGAYVVILIPDNPKSAHKIVCRGTASRNSATTGWMSLINDLQLFEMGGIGVRAIWPQLKRYISDPNNAVESTQIYGKSLGGGIAQQLAIKVALNTEATVQKLTTVCSVGAGKAVNKAYKELKNKFPVHHIRAAGNADDPLPSSDYVPTLGKDTVGHCKDPNDVQNLPVELSYVFEADTTPLTLSEARARQSVGRQFKELKQCFKKAHALQATMKKNFGIITITTNTPLRLNTALSTSRKNFIERTRVIGAWAVAFFGSIFGTAALLVGATIGSVFFLKKAYRDRYMGLARGVHALARITLSPISAILPGFHGLTGRFTASD